MNNQYKPLKELMGKTFQILGYREEMFGTNMYTIISVEYDKKKAEYYTSSIVLRRMLEDYNKNEKIPIKVELRYGKSTRGMWYAFREPSP